MKIITGGQTGIDQLALELCLIHNIPTGGWAPKGWRTETGPNLFLEKFGLKEMDTDDYISRTQENVKDSNFTVFYGDVKTPGFIATNKACTILNKRLYVNLSAVALSMMVDDRKDARDLIINIAGNRESKLSIEHRAFFVKEFGQFLGWVEGGCKV